MKTVVLKYEDGENRSDYTLCKCEKCKCFTMVDLSLHPNCPYCLSFREKNKLSPAKVSMSEWYNFSGLWRE